MSNESTCAAPPSASTAGSESPSTDALLDVLGDRRRRRALSVLLGRPGPVALDDLAEEVAAREAGDPPADTGSEEEFRVRTALHHVHLPKLDDAGLVEYCTERNVVETEAAAFDATPYLEVAATADR
jgi:DNA-binding transcriptional ArsR family regulator